ncbi:MAG: metallophosphoesterase [Bryobacteraceae bacterium]
MITRRRLLSAGAFCGSTLAYPVFLEPRWFETTRTSLAIPGHNRGTVRVLHLTDLHASWAVPMSSINNAIDIGLSEKPDLICLTGDFITHREDFDARAYTSALRKLASHRPAFAVLGNHDGGVWAKERHGYSNHSVIERILTEAGVHLLHNRSQHAFSPTLGMPASLCSLATRSRQKPRTATGPPTRAVTGAHRLSH